MRTIIKRIVRGASGATAIEYALIAACIAITIIAAIKGVGANLNSAISNISSNLR
jgi:pilus assembly protein Flp/PilA